jgi:hypothetical protein
MKRFPRRRIFVLLLLIGVVQVTIHIIVEGTNELGTLLATIAIGASLLWMGLTYIQNRLDERDADRLRRAFDQAERRDKDQR